MSWFQLDPRSISERARRNATDPMIPPSLATSLLHGVIGFTLVSLAGFAPWILAGEWLHRLLGEAGLSFVCAAVFIAASGLFLHRLIIGPGSLARFYKLFGIGFAGYSCAWIAGYMTLGGHFGGVIGLLAGTFVMAWVLTSAFDATRLIWKIAAVLFLSNVFGYFGGGRLEGLIVGLKDPCLFGLVLAKPARTTFAMVASAVCFGAGLGAGLGFSFHCCQSRARSLIAAAGKPELAPPNETNNLRKDLRLL